MFQLPSKLNSPWDSMSQTSSLITGTVVSFVVLLLTNKQVYLRVLFPGVVPDPKNKNPLPPGEISGCPYFGSFDFFPNTNKWILEQARKISSSEPVTLFKSYYFGGPGVIIGGLSRSLKVLNQEFSDDGLRQPVNAFGNAREIFGTHSMSFETDRAKYRFVKSLVQQSMTHDAVANGIGALRDASEYVMKKKILPFKGEGSIEMEKILKYMTLDVAWRQLLGLELESEEEIEEFHKNVAIWLDILTSPSLFFYAIMPMPLLEMTATFKAKAYLVKKISEKIDALEKRGSPDGSIVGNLYFTRDLEDPNKKLTKEQVIDNALLLIIAGSETSASTLTNAMLLMGLNPGVFRKLKEEQEELVTSKGDHLTKEMLDKDCPYLDGVVKEVMRLLPINGGPTRVTTNTISVDGKQVPKGWWVMISTSLTHAQDEVSKVEDGSHMDLIKGFKPERWMSKETTPKEYMPWGLSHRHCAGFILARIEMKMFLAIFSRQVESFSLEDPINVNDISWKFGAINTPKEGVSISIS